VAIAALALAVAALLIAKSTDSAQRHDPADVDHSSTHVSTVQDLTSIIAEPSAWMGAYDLLRTDRA
jgi:hypothetical protein